MNYINHYNSPLGEITLASNGEALTGLWFENQTHFGSTLREPWVEKDLPIFSETKRWLDLYFLGKVPCFTPPLLLEGTPFRKAVWEILRSIPYGQTMAYSEIAERIAQQRGIPKMSAQAVGGAVGHNPIGVIIPCHRVLGSDGSLTGYDGGIDKKLWLLKLEGAICAESES